MLKRFILLLICITSLEFYAQINTPSGATKPFGSNASYQYGMMPTNQTVNDTDIQAEYASWKTNYVENCGSDKARIKFDNTSETVSEGIAYGMLLAAYAADKDLFNRLWAYYKQHRNSRGVMHWKISGCNTVIGQNGATDAELDAAMALIVANYQWPNTTSPHNYNTDAIALINAIKNHEVNADGTFENGDAWKPSCRNPSYQAPAYARVYKKFMSDNGINQDAFWDNVTAKTEALFAANAHSSSGLNTNWCTPAGPPSGSCSGSGTAPDKFGYDACRAPWRQGVDILWFGPSASTIQPVVDRAITFWRGKGAANVQGGDNMNHDGTGSGNRNCAFWGPVGAQALAATSSAANQTFCDQMYTQNKMNSGASGYFTKILQMIGLFVQSGNFWNPYADPTTVANQNPTVSLTAPLNLLSICQGTSFKIIANASDSDGSISKVEFYNGNNLIGTANSTPFEYTYIPTTNGTISISAKAFDDKNASATSSSVSVTVNASPSAPTVTSAIVYCLNSNATQLQANGQNLKWYTSQTATNSTSTAPTPVTSVAGLTNYYVSQTINGCESNKAEIAVQINKTDAPTVASTVNYCQGSATTALSATGTSLKWYTSQTATNSTNTAPIPNSSVIGTTNYYVSQTQNGCESPRAQITVTIGTISEKPSVVSPVEYCQNSTSLQLQATGTNLKWYTVATNGNASSVAISPSTSVVGTTSYYVTQTVGACESAREKIDVTIKASPSAPIVSGDISYSLDESALALQATGTNLKWYTSATDNVGLEAAPVPNTNTLGTITYFVSQTSNGCESTRSSIKVTVINAFIVGKTPIAPQIDGVIDNVWSKVTGKEVSNLVQGTVSNSGDLSANFKTLWDDNYFYILGIITDESKTNDSPEAYQDDAIEVFFDYGNNKPSVYNENNAQYTFGYEDNIGSVNNNKTMAGVDFSIASTANGYTFEARFAWSSLGGLGKVGEMHGFEFGVNDDDNGGNRDGKLIWNGSTDDAWQNPSLYGSLKLGELISICEKPIKPSITVSKMEACEGETITVNSSISNSTNLLIQWLKDGIPVQNETQKDLIVRGTGVYSVKYADTYLDNSLCFSESNSVSLTINTLPTKPQIMGSPQACIYGATDIFSYNTTNTSGSTYNWTAENATILSGNGSSDVVVEFTKDVNATLSVVEVNSKNCLSPKAVLNIIFDCPNAIEENEFNIYNVYPNPFNEILYAEGFANYEIYDLQGRIVQTGKVDDGTIETTDLSNSVYVVKLSNSIETIVFKLTKE